MTYPAKGRLQRTIAVIVIIAARVGWGERSEPQRDPPNSLFQFGDESEAAMFFESNYAVVFGG
jgi:hypothetical protein